MIPTTNSIQPSTQNCLHTEKKSLTQSSACKTDITTSCGDLPNETCHESFCRPIVKRPCISLPDSLKEHIKNRIGEMKLSFIHHTPNTYGTVATTRTFDGKDILAARINLTENCVSANTALYQQLRDDETVHALGYRVGVAYIPAFKRNAQLFFDFSKEIIQEGMVNHFYLFFFNDSIDELLILDAATSNYMRRNSLFFGNLKELQEDVQYMLEKNRSAYTFNGGIFNSGNSDDGLIVNQYIFDKRGTPEEATRLLVNAWYGANVDQLTQLARSEMAKSSICAKPCVSEAENS